MSSESYRFESGRWFETAEGDLVTARVLAENGRWAHACFHAQQSGEKALKALWYSRGADPWGHSVLKLIEELSGVEAEVAKRLSDLREDAGKIDRFYIPTRYPNGLPDITPETAYFESDAAEAIRLADGIVERVRGLM